MAIIEYFSYTDISIYLYLCTYFRPALHTNRGTETNITAVRLSVAASPVATLLVQKCAISRYTTNKKKKKNNLAQKALIHQVHCN